MAHRDRHYADDRNYVDVRVKDRDRERDRDPLARYFQEDRRNDGGTLVLRQRDVETVERRPRPRSPSPVRYHEVSYSRSVSPMPPPREREVDRVEVRERVVDRGRERQYRSQSRDRVVTRAVSRPPRSLSSSPERQHDRIRINHRARDESPSPSPSPPPPAPRQVIHGPVVERDVITHYTDVDHGVVYAPQARRSPSPRPVRARERDQDTEIDIYSSRNHTDVDIRRSQSQVRTRSRSRSRVRLPPARASEKEVIVRTDRNRLDIDIDEGRNRRSHSEQPPRRRSSVAEEAQYLESRIDDRGRVGEAFHGATRDWTIIDVPPGTERVRMDGAGGGAAEVSWEHYSGVRRTKFVPDRDEKVVAAPRRKVREVIPARDRDRDSRDRINVQIVEQGGRRRDREVDVQTEYAPAAPEGYMVPGPNDMWTEITKDLVSREALERIGYEYSETADSYYILQYLYNDDIDELVELSDRIRRHRRKHRQSRDEIDVDVDLHHHRRSHSQHHARRDDDRVYEQEVFVDRHLHPRYRR